MKQMTVPARLFGFAAVLVGVFAAASFAGAALDPSIEAPAEDHQQGETGMNAHSTVTAEHGAAKVRPAGLAIAEGGYRLEPEQSKLPATATSRYQFRIIDSEGETVHDFDLEHERRMHLIVVRRDFEAFQHLHPEQRPDGSWVASLDTRLPGAYRAFADFATEEQSLTLAADLFVGGRFDPQPLAPVTTTADAGDGYEVAISSGDPEAGDTALTRFEVSLDGRPLDSVEPYLGADGHLVALREHDQAFLHTHPEGEAGGSGPIVFRVEYPSAGRYRLFLQFKHAGEVHTAAFTQVAAEEGVEHGD